MRFYNDRDYPVFFAENDQAMVFLAKTLESKGLISLSLAVSTIDITLTEDGWNRIAELEISGARASSNQAFVAMSFDSTLDKAWDNGFEKACGAAGYKALRVDLKEHNDKICDAIVAEIRKSRFVVADFTGHRGGVYFEAGFALGLGIPVIWTCRKDDLHKTHFDTRQYNHIDWEHEKDLFVRLKNRIDATILV
jgi:nucleoside 2-deoxyribosyltransferase